MYYFIFIPTVITYATWVAYVTSKLNIGGSNIWFALSLMSACVPIWTFMAKYSKRIVLDGVLYDILMFLSYTIAIAFFAKIGSRWNILQWVGLILCSIGLLVMITGEIKA